MHSALRHVPALLVKARPAHLTFFVTRRCTARCPFCFYAEERDAAGGAAELSLDEIGRVARSMGPLLWVLFSGGEPFLREDLVEIAGHFHDATRPRFLTFPTNGALPEVVEDTVEDVLGRCPDSVVVVKLSLDGVGADHDALRGTPGGFERALRTHARLAALASRHPRLELGVNTLFCAENQGRLDALVDLVARLEGVRAHTLTMVRGEGARAVDLDAYARLSALLEERWSGRFHRFAGAGLKAAQDRVQRRVIRETLLRSRRVAPCHAGRLSLVLSETGELSACEERRSESLGNVREAGLDVRAILRTPRARRVLASIASGRCHCTHECNLLMSVLFDPTMQPGLIREWARLRLGIGRRQDRPAAPFAPAATDGAVRREGSFA